MKNIITKNINSLQFIELRDKIQDMIEESISCLSQDDKKEYLEQLAWYEDCEMNDYFGGGFMEIWNEDEKVGEGIDTIAHRFVLNEDTRDDFKSAFEQARDNAYENRLKEIAEEIEDFEDEENE